MSDQTPDPIDKAYAQAEAMLDDEPAHAARRARVLGAVAQSTEAPPASAQPKPQSAWRRHGGWLAAASVAGVSLLIALQINPPADRRQAQPAAAAAVGAAPSPAPAQSIAEAPPREARATAPAPPLAITAQAARSPGEIPAAVAPPPPHAPSFEAAPPPPAPASAASAPPAADRVEELVVTGSRLEAAQRPAARAASGAMKASPAVQAEKLRAAAAAGRVAEVRALLAQGAPVDAPDDAGETALMKAVQGEHPAVAALLRRHGASLDLANREGVTARDMAASIDDADLNRALGLAP